jgi:hypothetical protein
MMYILCYVSHGQGTNIIPLCGTGVLQMKETITAQMEIERISEYLKVRANILKENSESCFHV